MAATDLIGAQGQAQARRDMLRQLRRAKLSLAMSS